MFLPELRLMDADKRRSQRQKRKGFKAETTKRMSPRSKYYCFSHSRASRIRNFSCWPTTVFHSPSTLKSISPALMSARNVTIFRIQIGIYDQWFQNFPCNSCEAPELGCIVGLTAILRLLERKNSTFLESVIFIVA